MKKPEEEKKEAEEDEEDLKMRTRQLQKEDWQILKQTMRSGEDKNSGSPNTDINLQEKAEEILELQNEFITKHMKYIRKVALLLKQEGELITNVQGIENPDNKYSIDKYVDTMRKITKYYLNIYSELDGDLEKL
jgi:hypothetical protein